MITIRSSNLARVMECPGSIAFTDLPENESGDPAKEGTATGEVLQFMCENKTLEIPPTMTHSKADGYPIDSDMIYYAREAAQDILSRAVTPISCEGEVVIDPNCGVRVVGHYDAAYWQKDNVLAVDDLKYGWGIVEVEKNWQLLSYAIGLMTNMNLWGRADMTIVLRIRQPRPHHEKGPVRQETYTRDELWKEYEVLVNRLQAIAAGEKTLRTSPKCRYCPAAAKCPALGKNFYRALEYVHEFVQDEMSPEELSFQLDTITRAMEIMKIKKDSLEALAVHKIKANNTVPGYAIEQKLGDRTWKKMVTPEVIYKMTGKKIVVEEMLSPAKAEKLGINKNFINSLCDRYQMGPKLVKRDLTELGDKIFGKPTN